MILNNDMEKASSKNLKRTQLNLLKTQIHRVYEHSKFYRRKFKEAKVHPSEIKTLDDLTKIPFTTREELEKNFWDILSVKFNRVMTIRQTSGTSGTPLTVALSRKDVDLVAEAYARKLTRYNVTGKDVIQVTGAYGLWQGAWSVHWGAERIGACVIPTGIGDTERQIRMIKQFKTTVLYAVTSYHFRILEVAKQLGEDLHDTNLRVAICVAEKPSRKQVELLKNSVGYETVMIDYGATEFPGFSVHCKDDPNYHHVWADYHLIEAVDPETLVPICDNKKGELVITTLQREAFPLIRYLSRDVTYFKGFQECSCGLNHPKIGVNIDRKDHMIKVRGTPIFPSEIETVLEKYPELSGKYQLVIDKRTPIQDMTLKVEEITQLNTTKQNLLRQRILRDMKNSTSVTMNTLTFVPFGSFKGKMQKTLVTTK